jgi:hypothetical protein
MASPVTTQIASGQMAGFSVVGSGIDSSLTDANIFVPGPLSPQPGTVRQDPNRSFFINGAQAPVMRFTVNIPAVAAQANATLILRTTAVLRLTQVAWCFRLLCNSGYRI